MTDLYPLAAQYVIGFDGDQERIKRFIQNDWVPMEVLRCVYETMVSKNEIAAIEKLEESEKERLKKIRSLWGTGDAVNRLKQVRVIYLIEQLQEKKIEL